MSHTLRITLFALLAALVIAACARSTVKTKLLDRKYQIYEIAVQSFEDCGGIWQGQETCVANLRPQIRGIAGAQCGRPPASIHSCAKRNSVDGIQVYCTVECLERPNVDESVLQRAERCQRQGGVWINDRCELNLE